MYVELNDINKSFGSYKASDHISFGIKQGKLVGLLGPSGSGKTTILRMIAGLETPDSGDIYINGAKVNDLEASKRGIGFVFQNYALFRYMTVFDNIAFGLRVQKEEKAAISDRVEELISLIGLSGLEKRYPNQLSGGQRQRVAFARALAPRPQLLLLDEPFAAIDAKVRLELRSWLREMISRVNITSIFVTHDQDEAIEVADEIIITNAGRVEQIGTPSQIYKTPQTAFVAQFIGQSAVVEDFSRFKGFQSIKNAGQAVIRPEFISLTRKDEVQRYSVTAEEGVVRSVSFRGSNVEVQVQVNGAMLTANRLLDDPPVSPGEAVDVFLYRVYAFDGQRAHVVENEVLQNVNSVVL